MKNELENNEDPSRFYDLSFKLTPSERKFPATAIKSFCERHTMEDLQMHLKEWLSSTKESELPFFIKLSRDIEKMMEAIFITNEKEVSGLIDEEGKIFHIMEYYASYFDELKSEYDAAVKEHNNFNIRYQYLHSSEDDPLLRLNEVFEFSGDDSIKLELGGWLKAAVCNEHNEKRFYDSEDIPRLQFFFENFQSLIEALFILTEAHVQDIESLKNNIRNAHLLFLKEDEKRNPVIVIKRFCNTFPLKYTQTEMWGLLEAVISSNDKPLIKREDVIFYYERLLCLLESAYVLDAQDERIVRAIQKLNKVTI